MDLVSNNTIATDVAQEVRQIVISDDVEMASEFLSVIEERLAAKRGGTLEELTQWQKLEQQLYWVLFLQQSWDRCVELFRSGLGAIVEFLPGIDVVAKLTAKLITEDVAIRDQYREKIKHALTENTLPLTSAVQVQNAHADGTVVGWLQQYIAVVGAGQTDQLAYQQWLAQDPLLAALKPVERERVEWLTKLYEELKHSSQTMEGLEEGIYTTDERGRPAYYHRGQFRLIDPDGSIRRRMNAMKQHTKSPGVISVPAPAIPPRLAPPAPVVPPSAPAGAGQWTQSQIVAKYQGDQTKANAVAQRGAVLQQSTANAPAALRQALYGAVTAAQPDEIEIVALLQLLASTDALDDVLRDDSRFQQLVAQALERRGNATRLADLKLYPTAPQFVQFLLELLLQEKVGLTEDQAARWGLQLANALKRAGNGKYSQIAYFDVTDGTFHWRR